MPVFTFSTPTKRPEEAEVIEAIKEHCEQHNLNFSAVVVTLLKKYKEEVLNDRRQEA